MKCPIKVSVELDNRQINFYSEKRPFCSLCKSVSRRKSNFGEDESEYCSHFPQVFEMKIYKCNLMLIKLPLWCCELKITNSKLACFFRKYPILLWPIYFCSTFVWLNVKNQNRINEVVLLTWNRFHRRHLRLRRWLADPLVLTS